MNQLTARRVYEHRQQNGPFRSRKQLLEVSGLGDATFVQAAGFLKIVGGEQLARCDLDSSRELRSGRKAAGETRRRAVLGRRRRQCRPHSRAGCPARSCGTGHGARHRPTHARRHDRSALPAGPRSARRLAAADLPQGCRQVRRPAGRHGTARHGAERRRLRRVRRRRPLRQRPDSHQPAQRRLRPRSARRRRGGRSGSRVGVVDRSRIAAASRSR